MSARAHAQNLALTVYVGVCVYLYIYLCRDHFEPSTYRMTTFWPDFTFWPTYNGLFEGLDLVLGLELSLGI